MLWGSWGYIYMNLPQHVRRDNALGIIPEMVGNVNIFSLNKYLRAMIVYECIISSTQDIGLSLSELRSIMSYLKRTHQWKGDTKMQLRCTNCHKPFALSKETVHSALDQISNENLNHFNAHCPHCRRVNRVSKKQLRRAAPTWSPADSETSSDEEINST
jgi:phage FluMu protein Com